MAEKIEKYSLSPSEAAVIAKLGLGGATDIAWQRVEAKAGDILFEPGDKSGAYLILISGQIRICLTTKSDREVVLYRVKSEQTCLITTTALLRSQVYFASGIAEKDVSALAMTAADFRAALAVNPDFTAYVMEDYARRVESLVSLIDRLTAKDIGQDLARALLGAMDDRNEVHITQIDLARNIGTAREVIARKLGALEQKGVIKRARGKIIILDKDRLV